jgi:hypothetical protein
MRQKKRDTSQPDTCIYGSFALQGEHVQALIMLTVCCMCGVPVDYLPVTYLVCVCARALCDYFVKTSDASNTLANQPSSINSSQ